MTRFALVATVVAALAVMPSAAAAPPGQSDVIVVLRHQAALPSTSVRDRAARIPAVVAGLRSLAATEQRRIRALLAVRKGQGRVSLVEPFWVVDGLHVVADRSVVDELRALPEVADVQPNATVQAPSATTSGATAEWNVARVRAPELWDLGVRGQGVVVATMDTGVDATHPDLATRWRGGANSWYDPNGEHPSTPTDVSGHGTATMGAIVGGDAGGTAIGVAPDARWIAVKIFNDHGSATTAGIHAGFQWLLDPDHNPATADAPNVVNGSWSLANGGCDLSFQPDLRALRSAGILPVFAAGNAGPSAGTSRSPANNPEAFAVGGTDANDLIDPSSSRGPSACGGAFPQLTAPGVGVRTTDLYGLYASVSGTSIAAPEAAGALALLLGAFPGSDADRQAAALQSGAVDLGAAGPDSDYGAGRLDARAAYDWLASAPDFTLSASPASVTVSAGSTATVAVDVGVRNGFAGEVALSLSGLTANQASWSFAPASIQGAGSSQLTIAVAPGLAPGTYPLAIRGTSGAVTHSAGVSLVVPAPPDFTISASPSSRTTAAGGGVVYDVAVGAISGFAGDVALSLSGLSPGQATWSFAPATVSGSGTAQLAVTTAAGLAPGTYPLTLTGTSGGTAHSAAVSLVVAPPPDFTLAATPSSRTTAAGGSVSFTISASATGGFTGDIALSLAGLSGSQASWSFQPPVIAAGSGTAQLTVTTASSLAAGSYQVVVTGSSGARTHTATVTLTVTGSPDFGLALAPASATVVAGQATAYTVSVASLGGFAGSVSLSLSGLPAGATASISPNPVRAPGYATLTVRTTRFTSRGTFTLTVTGRSGLLTRKATAGLTIRS